MAEPHLPNRPGEVTPLDFDRLKLQIDAFGSIKSLVVTGSMEPLIRVGETIEIKRILSHQELKRFDTIAFWDGEKLVCHYFLCLSQISNGSITALTKGLNSQDLDLPVPIERILGRVDRRLTIWMRILQAYQIWKRK